MNTWAHSDLVAVLNTTDVDPHQPENSPCGRYSFWGQVTIPIDAPAGSALQRDTKPSPIGSQALSIYRRRLSRLRRSDIICTRNDKVTRGIVMLMGLAGCDLR